MHHGVSEGLGGLADGNSDVVVHFVGRFEQAEVGDGHAGDAVLASQVSAHSEIEGHLWPVIWELHLTDLGVGVIFVIHILLEVLLWDLVTAARDVDAHKVSRLHDGGLKLDASSLIEKVDQLVTRLLKHSASVFEVVFAALVFLSPNLFHGPGNSDLSWNIVHENGGLVHVERLLDELGGSN